MPKTNFKLPMLAKDFDPEKVHFPVMASPKIDGIRAVIDKSDSNGDLIDPYARSGKIIPNKHVQQTIGLTPLYGLDGELVVGDPAAPDVCNRTVSGVMSIEGKPDFLFWVFDLRGEEGCYFERYSKLIDIFKNGSFHAEHPNLRLLAQDWIDDMDALLEYEAKMLAAGYEGIMIRDPDSKYKYGRSTVRSRELLKVKRVSHDEAEILGLEEMMANENEAFTDELGRTKRSSSKDGLVPADTLGAFVCKNESLWPGQVFNISPGVLTHAERKEVWDNPGSYLGRTITFKHLAHGAKDKPRHGRFNSFRDQIDT